jgi:hypothetical protein
VGLTPPSSAAHELEKAFPYYLSIGMTYDQYWHGDVMLVYDYNEAEMLRRERRNQEMWLQGLYIYRATGAAIGSAFRKKGTDPIPYEYDLYPLTQEDADKREEREEEKRRKATMEYFSKGGL